MNADRIPSVLKGRGELLPLVLKVDLVCPDQEKDGGDGGQVVRHQGAQAKAASCKYNK